MGDPSAKSLGLEEGNAVVGRRTLYVAIDETGNEDFKSKDAFFGIAGVMGIGPEMVRAERRWRKMKALRWLCHIN